MSGETKAEPVEQDRLIRIRADAAPDSELAWIRFGGRQDDVGAVNAVELFKQSPRAVAQPSADHPLFKCFPEHVGEEADQDVCFDPCRLLMPDRTDRKIALLRLRHVFPGVRHRE